MMVEGLPVWAFASVTGLASFLGVRLADRFDGIRIGPAASTLVALAAALATFWLAPGPASLPQTAWTVVLIAALACLGVIDAQTRTLPDLISVPLIFLGLTHAALQGGLLLTFAVSAATAIGLGAIAGALLRQRPGWMGSGDVLLIAAALAWVGPALLPDLMLLSAVLLIAQSAARLVLARLKRPYTDPDTGLPLAPALGIALAAIWIGGPLF